MQIKNCSVDSLIPYVNNARTHSQEQIALIASSIKEFGFNEPIAVDPKKGIIAGHGRLQAAKLLGLKEVPTIELSHLTRTQQKAYLLAHNKLADRAGWDTGLLLSELDLLKEEGFNLDLTGFDSHEIEDMRPEVLTDGMIDQDSIPENEGQCRTAPGDIWRLGDHLLMCGDATAPHHIECLMEGNKADILFTDPPYGIDYQDVKGKHDKLEGDETLDGIQSLISQALTFACPMFICCNWKSYSTFEKAMIDAGKPPKACIVWDKGSRVQNLDKFGKQHEFILYHGPFGGEKTIDVDVWQIDREVQENHPTAKPVDLIVRALKSFKGKNVLDLFGGSGSTLIAAEKTGRTSFTMEISPQYCDVILARWEKFTGRKAGCIND